MSWRWLSSGLALALMVLLLPVAVGSSSSDLPAQDNRVHSNAADDHHVGLGPDRVLIGPEYLPRRTDLPNKLIVRSGQVIELPEDATYDYIEVAGTLRASRAHNTTTRFTHLVILRDGYLDVGTQADPIPCDRKVDFVVRDVPIDTTKDPFQWGNGLANFGRQTRVGCSKTAWVESVGSISSGATKVTLASPPSGWQVGDELLIPDTATPSNALQARRESKITIAGINGTQLDLSAPLDFAHENVTDPSGNVVLRPRVANLTRNVTIRSENPDGTRGHTADIGQMSSWDIRYNQLKGLGRTANTKLDETVLGKHVGTNQPGKYTEHHHHAQSSVGSADVGNVYIGNPAGSKWGLVVHGTSDALIERNIALDFPGAGFVTEDGYEVRNTFRKNFAAGSIGNGVQAQGNIELGCPGCEGSGFWFRGIINTFDGNEGWNNRSGMTMMNQQQPPGMYPNVPGGKPDTAVNHFVVLPISVTGNILAANTVVGLEEWATARFPDVDLIAAYNGQLQVFGVISDNIHLWLRNPRVICREGTAAIGVHSSDAYVASFEIQGGRIAGCKVGITGGGSLSFMKITETALQNQVNIDKLPRDARFENVMHVPLSGLPHQYIVFDNGAIWNGTGPLPQVQFGRWIPNRGSRLVVKNWQGTGQDYLLFYRQQLGSNPAWHSAPGVYYSFNVPIKGLTMQQAWDTLGMSYAGDVLKDNEAVPLDGLVNGFARAGLGVAFSPPRAVVTFPTMREPAVVSGGVIHVFALVTGDPSAASDTMMMSVDGDPPRAFTQSQYSFPDDRSFDTTHISPGVHEIRVWRTQKAKPTAALAGSEFVSRYCVGACQSTSDGHAK
jgi:hypothetical protein